MFRPHSREGKKITSYYLLYPTLVHDVVDQAASDITSTLSNGNILDIDHLVLDEKALAKVPKSDTQVFVAQYLNRIVVNSKVATTLHQHQFEGLCCVPVASWHSDLELTPDSDDTLGWV